MVDFNLSIDDIMEEYLKKKKEGTESKPTAEEPKASLKDTAEKAPKKEETLLDLLNKKPTTSTSSQTRVLPNLSSLKSENTSSKVEKEALEEKNEKVAQEKKKDEASVPDIITPELKKKIIPKTSTISIDKNADEEEREKLLKIKREHRIKQFLLENEIDNGIDEDEKEEESDSGEGEFKNYDEAKNIHDDFIQIKHNLIVRLAFLIIASLFSLYIMLANEFGWSIISSLNKLQDATTYVFVNVILGILAVFFSYTVIAAGITNLMKGKADSDTLCSVATIMSIISAALMISNPDLVQRGKVNLFITVSIFGLLINTLGKLLIISRTERNFKYISGGYEKYALVNVTDETYANHFTKGAISDFPALATMKKTDFVDDFLKNSYSADIGDSFSKYFAPIMIGVAALFGLISVFFVDKTPGAGSSEYIYTALGTFAGVLSICSSMGIILISNIPLVRASNKHLRAGAVMLGYSAVNDFSETNSVMTDATQLFPDGMIDIVNLKQISAGKIEEGILLAASLSFKANSILKPLFNRMIKGKTDMLYNVDSYIYEDDLGLSGWIDNKRVLFGTRAHMEHHSVTGLPTIEKEEGYNPDGYVVLYLSISGNVSTMFILKANAEIETQTRIQELEKNGVTIIVKSNDAMLSVEYLSELFGVSANNLKVIPARFHNEYEKVIEPTPRQSSSMVCSGRFNALAMLIVSAKRLLVSSAIGLSVQLISAILGGIISIALILMSSFGQLSETIVFAYNLIWTLITIGVQFMKKV